MALTTSGSRASNFIGRQQEMAVLNAALDDALAGRGQIVMLAGEPGIGKTRLAQELVASAERRGACVLWGWCYEHQGAPPYWPWLQCIRAYIEPAESGQLRQDMGPGAADIYEILPELTSKLEGLERPPALEPEQARFRLFFSITTFLKNVSRSQPLVLVIDDLHWADESSLLLLEFLAREIATSAVMVVGTYQDTEVSGRHPLVRSLGNLVRESHFQRAQLAGLSRNEVGEFVEARSGIPLADTAVDTLYQRTGGNPLFVGEVVGLVAPEEMPGDHAWIANMPEAVREAILRRLSRLSEPCIKILQTASVIGREFDIPLLRVLSQEFKEDELLESLDEALRIRIIEPLSAGPGGYRFGHALIQQAVSEEIPSMRKAQAHAAVGQALELIHQNNLDEHAGELAYHFAEAGAIGGTEKMVRYSLLAGEKAQETFAYEQALVHFGRVLAAKEGLAVDAETAAALFGLSRAQANTLPRQELRETHLNLSRAFDYYESVGDTAHIVSIIYDFPFPHLSETGLRFEGMVARALELVPNDSIEAGRLHHSLGYFQGLGIGEYQSARESFDLALAIARRKGDADLEIRTLNTAAQTDLWDNRFSDCLNHSLVAIDLAITASDPRGEVISRYWAFVSSGWLGDMEQLQRQASMMLEPAERLRDRIWLTTAYKAVAWPLMLQGDWESAKVANQRGLDLMPREPRSLVQRIFLEAYIGDQNQAEIHLERLEDLVRQVEVVPNTPNAGLALVAPLVWSIFGVKRSKLGETSITNVLSSPAKAPWFTTWARVGAAMLAVMKDDTEAAREQYAELKASSGIMVFGVNVDRVLGQLAVVTGILDDASIHFNHAYAFCRKAGFRPELAWTCYDHAAALIQRDGPGDREKAESLFEEALAIATELGMIPLVEKASGLREELLSKPAKSSAYPYGLTQREVEILRLISGGKTDREIGEELFISVKTVGNHVSNILNKTSAANRTEAAVYAARQGITADPKTD